MPLFSVTITHPDCDQTRTYKVKAISAWPAIKKATTKFRADTNTRFRSKFTWEYHICDSPKPTEK